MGNLIWNEWYQNRIAAISIIFMPFGLFIILELFFLILELPFLQSIIPFNIPRGRLLDGITFFTVVSITMVNSLPEGKKTVLHSLPYSRTQIVSAKYVANLIFIMISHIPMFIPYFTSKMSFASILFSFLFCLFTTSYLIVNHYIFSFKPRSLFSLIYLFLTTYFTLMIVELLSPNPIGFLKFLPLKIEPFFSGLVEVLSSIILRSIDSFTIFSTTYSKSELYFILIMITFLIYALSWLISVKIHQNKDI